MNIITNSHNFNLSIRFSSEGLGGFIRLEGLTLMKLSHHKNGQTAIYEDAVENVYVFETGWNRFIGKDTFAMFCPEKSTVKIHKRNLV